jgi:hypothetical protein
MGIGWPTEAPDFDPPFDFEICQLVSGTLDGFPTIDELQEPRQCALRKLQRRR